MRLHALRLQAFGPFATEQRIDFEPLGAGGLFLLDGPTGAGKSTVLDAITFALYGPGDGGGWGRLHSHFAAPGVEPEVQLEFSLRGVRQRITRSPEYLRPKRRGDGTTVEKAQVHLERWDGGRWTSRSSRKDEVGEMLADDLGLTREQFTQVVLLPQGEFMRFLRAGDDERRALLTKLFGTQLYDRITDELDRRRSVAARHLDAAGQRLRVQLGAVAQAAGLDADEREALAGLDAAARAERLVELAQQLAEAVRTTTERAASAREVATACRAGCEGAEAAADRMRRMIEASEACAQHEATRPQFEQAAIVLRAAERAQPVRPLVDAVDAAEAQLAGDVRALLQLDPGADAAARRGEGAEDLLAGSARCAQSAAELTHLVARERSAGEVFAERAEARRALEQARSDVARLAERGEQLPRDLAAVDSALTVAREHAADLPALRQRHESLSVRLAAAQALAALVPQLADAAAAHERSFAAFEQTAARHRLLLETRLSNMAAELAATLTDGEPCVVCGAPEHPAPATPVPGAADADEVEAAEAARALAERAYDQARSRAAELKEARATLVATAASGPAAGAEPLTAELAADLASELAAELAECAAAITRATTAAAERIVLDKARAELEVESNAHAAARRIAESALASAATRAEACDRAADDLQAELRAAAADHPSVEARCQALNEQARDLAARAEAVARIGVAAGARDAAVARAAAEAVATGFDDLDAARSAVLPATRSAELRELVDAWQSAAHRLRGALDVAEFAGLDVADADAVTAQAHAARLAAAAADSDARAAELEARRAHDTLSAFESARAHLEAARAEHDALHEAARPVAHLAQLAKGMAGQRRVNLTTYVLRQWFDQVVAAANVRLSGMSSGRYELVRVDEGASKNERSGLTVQVLDRHTGQRRNPRSLSGGETFYTSLALALGLADVVRAEAGGVDLDTLFIDEGFGSLDADTLDQVMAVIDDLRDRGRTVGIVSHVSELKNRIAERIEVRRLADGSSALRVVA